MALASDSSTSSSQSPTLVLASTSPYRKELLARLKIPFQVARPKAHEEEAKKQLLKQGTSPENLALELSKIKALSLREDFPNSYILGSDQLLDFEGEILGKAPNRDLAIAQLQKLSSKTHKLITCYALVHGEKLIYRTHISLITLRNLSLSEIERYVDKEHPFDCAGSYKMESLGISLVRQMDCSDPSSIIGLPLSLLSEDLRGLGFQIP